MEKRHGYIYVFAALIFSLGLLYEIPAEGKSLTTEEVTSMDTSGTFSLILYGGRFYRDVESLALLDLEGDGYTLDPYVPDFDYRVETGLSAKEALDRAERFLSAQYAFRRTILSKILDGNGKTIGYELRPLYDPLTFGITDVLDVDYVLQKDGKVRVYIRLAPSVESQIYGGGGPRDDGH